MQTSVVAPAEVPSPAPSRPKSLPTVPALLLKLVFACLLPALLGAGFMIYMEYVRGHAQQQASTEISVQDKLSAVDAQLARAELFAQTLAISGSLSRQDFATFHQRTLRLLRESNLKLSVILYDAGGQQLLNTNMPYGSPLPKRQDTGQIQSVFSSGRMLGSSVIKRTSDGHAMVGIWVPVFSGQKVVYALAVGFAPQNLNTLLAQHHSQDEALMAILDGTGTIAARSHQAEKFIGLKGHPQLLKELETQSQGTFEIATSLGFPLKATYRRSLISGWTVVVAVPSRFISTPLTHNLLVLCLGGVALLCLSLGSAWMVGKRISKSLWALRATAMALGDGTLPAISDGITSETAELSQALQVSARSLRHRTQELLVANESLLARSAELTEAQHIAKIGNWKWHASTGTFSASDELLRLYGRKILLPFAAKKGTMFMPAAWEKLRTAVKATLQSKTGFSLLLPTFTADGTPLWSRVNGELVYNASGKFTGLRGTLQDVDLQVKAEAAIVENAKRYRTLFEGSPVAIVVHCNGIVAVANTSAAKLFAAAAAPDLAGKSLNQFVHPDFQQAVAARLALITRPGESALPFELKLINLNGLTFSAQVLSTAFLIEGEHFVQTYIHDLTEERRRDAELAHLRNEMHHLLIWQVAQHTVAALAHEVNQPLASASLLCEAAKRMVLTDGLSVDVNADKSKRLEQTLMRITSDIERAGDILKNLLVSVTQPDITRLPVRVNALVAESVQTALDEGVFDCRIITNYAAALPVVKANQLQIVKVLLNLIHNGAQAMNNAQIANGRLWISTALATDGDEVCVSVRDEGPGISAGLEQEVFEPFVSTKSYGLGMGLTISRTLVEANGGKLWYTRNDGAGVTFNFTMKINQ